LPHAARVAPEAESTATASDRVADGLDAATLTVNLASQDSAEQLNTLIRLVQRLAAEILGHQNPGTVPAIVTFRDLGFDSLMAVELRNRVGRATGLRPASTLVFDHPSPEALAQHLQALLAPEPEPEAGPEPTLLAALHRLETGVDDTVMDDATYDEIHGRLKDLIRRWSIGRPVAAATSADPIDTGTDEELFQFLDGELGGA
ncbi:phosphopantetheine-binding protein, partial [Catenulispora rubra]|uniref:phosphopantetheine-binding protein n=1 Tax=Catenulispora rubra TaxID=280293 RepID=UPI001E6490E5